MHTNMHETDVFVHSCFVYSFLRSIKGGTVVYKWVAVLLTSTGRPDSDSYLRQPFISHLICSSRTTHLRKSFILQTVLTQALNTHINCVSDCFFGGIG